MSVLRWREEPIAKKHNRKRFDCGHPELNHFLTSHARQAHESGATKTYVAVNPLDGMTIFGFYTLLPTDIDFEVVPPEARPSGSGRHPLGGFRLARLAVSKSVQGQGLGGALLLSAARRCILASASVGGTMILIDAKDDKAASWYKSYGALAIPKMPLTLVIPYASFPDSIKSSGMPIT
jgi:GNAT superfamily N-acetyltransferase